MNLCGKVDKKIELWESEGTLSKNDSDIIRAHLGECASCQKKYGSLLVLISGESRAENPYKLEESDVSEKLTVAIMQKIPNTAPERKTHIRPSFILAAAAAVVILVFSINFIKPALPVETDFIVVEFRLAAPSVNSVSLVGDFNNWEDGGIVLTDSDQDGIWTTVVTLKKGNLYKYNYIIDNEIWIADPESEITLDDGFGGKSSVIHI
ncbi:MAG: hypothetical protein JEY99_16365 [Spirochaetales bacterium]|nr:hypothetical protein [Spirochaetales bacterium]